MHIESLLTGTHAHNGRHSNRVEEKKPVLFCDSFTYKDT